MIIARLISIAEVTKPMLRVESAGGGWKKTVIINARRTMPTIVTLDNR